MRSISLTILLWTLGSLGACSSGSNGSKAPDVPADAVDVLQEVRATDIPGEATDAADIGRIEDRVDCDQQVCFDCPCRCSGDCGGCFSVCDPLPPGIEDCSCCEACPDADEQEVHDSGETEVQGPPEPPVPTGTCTVDGDCVVLPHAPCCPPPPNPCTLKPVLGNADDLAALQTWKDEVCDPPPECPDYAKPQCDDCLDILKYSASCKEGTCVVVEEMDCTAACEAAMKDPEVPCPFISHPELVNGESIELCGCAVVTQCDPIQQLGCLPEQKCTLVKNQPACAPTGYQPKNSPCNPDSDTCAAGLICNPLNWCAPICTEDYQCENEGYEFCNKTQYGPVYGYCMVYLY